MYSSSCDSSNVLNLLEILHQDKVGGMCSSYCGLRWGDRREWDMKPFWSILSIDEQSPFGKPEINKPLTITKSQRLLLSIARLLTRYGILLKGKLQGGWWLMANMRTTDNRWHWWQWCDVCRVSHELQGFPRGHPLQLIKLSFMFPLQSINLCRHQSQSRE